MRTLELEEPERDKKVLTSPRREPTKLKRTLITWLAIYPPITLIFFVFGDWLLLLPIPIRTLLLTVVLVPFMTFLGVPLLSKWFAGWLNR